MQVLFAYLVSLRKIVQTKHMLKLMERKCLQFYAENICLSKPVLKHHDQLKFKIHVSNSLHAG